MSRVDGEGLPTHWLLTTIGEVGAVRVGRPRSPANSAGRLPGKYVRAANITGRGLDLSDVLEMDFTPAERAIYRLQTGDVLLAEASGSASQVGRAAIWDDEIPDCCYQNTVIRFRPHAVTAKYALTVFRQQRDSGAFARASRGVGILHLGAQRFSALPFPLPPLGEQARIGEMVDSRTFELREAERSLESALGHLREQDKEILSQAASGRLGGESPRNSRGEELPEGWSWARVGDIGEAKLGRMRSPEHSHGPDMRPYLRVANVLEDRIDTSDILEMNFSPEEYEVYKLQPGDILLNDGQSPELVGRPAMYRGEVPGACYQNHIIRFRAGTSVNAEFALLVFLHYLHSGRFREAARWTTNIATLSLKRFSDLPFPLPPLPEQARIAAEARGMLDDSRTQQEAVRQALTRLPAMESELLRMAVSGKLAPRDPSEESPAELLSRLGPPPQEQPARSSTSRRGGGGAGDADITVRRWSEVEEEPHMPDSTGHGRPSDYRSLPDVLSGRKGPVRLPDLFRLAGYNRDRPSDVELFYIALHREMGRTIRIVGEERENSLVEVIDRAAD